MLVTVTASRVFNLLTCEAKAVLLLFFLIRVHDFGAGYRHNSFSPSSIRGLRVQGCRYVTRPQPRISGTLQQLPYVKWRSISQNHHFPFVHFRGISRGKVVRHNYVFSGVNFVLIRQIFIILSTSPNPFPFLSGSCLIFY